MKKAKFKVGDKVVVFKSGSDVIGFAGGWIRDMEHMVGKEFTIKSIQYKETLSGCRIGYRFVEDSYLWDERILRSASEKDLIVVYRDGSKVVALNKKTGEKGVARCNPNDTFDFDTGAKIAFGRLFHYEEKPEPKMREEEEKPHVFYARCIEAKAPYLPAATDCGAFFTAGKVYKVVDGTITDEGGFTWGCKGSFHDASELSSYWTAGPYMARFCDATEREYKA